MRIVKEKTLYEKCRHGRYKNADSAIRSWISEVRQSKWNNAAELKEYYKHASIVNSKRVVFNIRGNKYRLIADIEYRFKTVYIIWFGTHNEYGRIDAEKISYGN